MDGNFIRKIPTPYLKRIFSVSIILIAIISFFVTAEGLNSFSFTGQAYRGFMISLAIQTSLAAMHLKIRVIISNSQKIFSKIAIRSTYIALLAISIWFAYVYIANNAYDRTKLIDAHSISQRITGEEISRAELFISRQIDETMVQLQYYLVRLQDNFSIPIFATGTFSTISANYFPIPSHNAGGNEIVRQRNQQLHHAINEVNRGLRDLYALDAKLIDLFGNTLDVYTLRNLSRIQGELNRLQGMFTQIDVSVDSIAAVRANTTIDELVPEIAGVDAWWHRTHVPGIIHEYLNVEESIYGHLLQNYHILQRWISEFAILNTMVETQLIIRFDDVLQHMASGGIEYNVDFDTARSNLITAVTYFIINQQRTTSSESPILLQSVLDNLNKLIELRGIIAELEGHRHTITRIEYATDFNTLRQGWGRLIDELSRTIHHIPMVTMAESHVYDATSSANRLTEVLYRRYFAGINPMERAWWHLFGYAPRFSAIASFLFAFFLDTAPYGLGLAIYFTMDKKDLDNIESRARRRDG